MASDKIVEGKHKGCLVASFQGKAYVVPFCGDRIYITPESVSHYELMNATEGKSAASAIGRAAVGAALLGPIGLLAGATAKKKGTYMVALYWSDGEKSLVEAGDKVYKAIMQSMF